MHRTVSWYWCTPRHSCSSHSPAPPPAPPPALSSFLTAVADQLPLDASAEHLKWGAALTVQVRVPQLCKEAVTPKTQPITTPGF